MAKRFDNSSNSTQFAGFLSSIFAASVFLNSSSLSVCNETRKAINSRCSLNGRCAAWTFNCVKDMAKLNHRKRWSSNNLFPTWTGIIGSEPERVCSLSCAHGHNLNPIFDGLKTCFQLQTAQNKIATKRTLQAIEMKTKSRSGKLALSCVAVAKDVR